MFPISWFIRKQITVPRWQLEFGGTRIFDVQVRFFCYFCRPCCLLWQGNACWPLWLQNLNVVRSFCAASPSLALYYRLTVLYSQCFACFRVLLPLSIEREWIDATIAMDWNLRLRNWSLSQSDDKFDLMIQGEKHPDAGFMCGPATAIVSQIRLKTHCEVNVLTMVFIFHMFSVSCL